MVKLETLNGRLIKFKEIHVLKRTVPLSILLISLLLIAYFLLWPLGFEPPEFVPEPAPILQGVLEPKYDLENVSAVYTGLGPEDIAFDNEGWMYSGLANGQIVRRKPRSNHSEEWVNTRGRPLGLAFNTQGDLIVADAKRGLLSVDSTGQISVLASTLNDVPFKFVDDLVITNNGVIYFVDSSKDYGIGDDYIFNSFMDGRPLGRLLSYDPNSKTVEIIHDKLFFPNGITLSHDGQAVLVSEMMTYRVLRIEIGSSNKGETSVFVNNLPGFPNNISRTGRDSYRLALSAPRNPEVEDLQANPFLRKVLMRLPDGIISPAKPVKYGLIIELNHRGKIINSIQDPSGMHAFMLTSATEYQGDLYLGSIGDSEVKSHLVVHVREKG